jgi:hypothetical protein
VAKYSIFDFFRQRIDRIFTPISQELLQITQQPYTLPALQEGTKKTVISKGHCTFSLCRVAWSEVVCVAI